MIRGLAVGMALAFVALTGCAPTVLWAGRTQDRCHRIELLRDGGRDYAVVDGVRRAAFHGIAAQSIVSRGDRFAFAARVGKRWVVVHDDRWSELWDSVAALTLSSSGRLAYAAERDGAWQVVVDGDVGPPFDTILPDTLQFDRDGRRIAYVAKKDGRTRAVIDGKIGPQFDGVGQLVFSDDGKHYAYAARRGKEARVVVDGQLGPAWYGVAHLTLSPVGGHVAYAAHDGRDWRVLIDGEPGPAVTSVRQVLFRDDGRYVAWAAREEGKLVIAIDDTPIAVAPKLSRARLAFCPGAANPDRPGLASAVSLGQGGQQMLLDGVPLRNFDYVGVPVWSSDGRLAYSARRGETWVVMLDGREIEAGTAVGDPVFSRDGKRFGYVARRRDGAYVIVDGREQRFDLAFDDTLTFSADGSRWAVVAGDLRRERLFFAIERHGRIALPAIEVYSSAIDQDTRKRAGMNILRTWSRAEAERVAARRSRLGGRGAR